MSGLSSTGVDEFSSGPSPTSSSQDTVSIVRPDPKDVESLKNLGLSAPAGALEPLGALILSSARNTALPWALLTASIGVVVSIVIVEVYILLKDKKEVDVPVYTWDGFRNECKNPCEEFNECPPTILKCRCMYGYKPHGDSCVVQTEKGTVEEMCRSSPNREPAPEVGGNEKCKCVSAAGISRTRMGYCTKPHSGIKHCWHETEYRCPNETLCGKDFEFAVDFRANHTNESFIAAFPRLIFDTLGSFLTDESDVDFLYARTIQLIELASNVDVCTDPDLDNCLDRVLKEKDVNTKEEPERRRLATILETFSKARNVTVLCEANRHDCKYGTSEDWQGWLTREKTRARHVRNINEWYIVSALHSSPFFLDGVHDWNASLERANSRSIGAFLYTALMNKVEGKYVKMMIKQELTKLRLLKPDGGVFFGFHDKHRINIEEECVTALIARYVNVRNLSVPWNVTVAAFSDLKEADTICKFERISAAFKQQEILSEGEDLILPLWTYNRFCILKPTSEECHELVVASIIAERFKDTYEIMESERRDPYALEYRLGHLLCNVEQVCDIDQFVKYRSWVHALTKRERYHSPELEIHPLARDCLVKDPNL